MSGAPMIRTQNLVQMIKIIIKKEMSREQVSTKLQGLFNADQIAFIYQGIKTDNTSILNTVLNHCITDGQFTQIENYKEFCLRVLRKDGLALRYVDEEFPYDFYLTPVQENGFALEYVPKLTSGYEAVCIEAVKKTPFAVQYVRRYLPYEINKKIFLTAVSLDGLALEYIFAAQNDVDVCLAAVKNNIFSLAFVEEDLRQQLIETGQAEDYLEKNYMSHVYFPPHEKAIVATFLARVEHIIVFNKQDLEDKELSDVRAVYANAPKRKGKITSIATEDLTTLLTDVQMMQEHNHKVHFFILGHANVRVEKIAGLTTSDIAKLLEDFPLINRLTLFGCKSVQAYKLEEEKEIIRKVSREKTSEPISKYGLLITKDVNSRSPERLLKTTGLQATFIIVLPSSDNSSNCYIKYIEKQNNEHIFIKDSALLSTEDRINLQNIFTGKKALHSAFGKKLTLCTLKTDRKPLEFAELEVLNRYFSRDKFSRTSPLYPETKTKYPFLRSIQITEDESRRKLMPSLLQKLIREIGLNSKITHEITIKGYSNIIHVDTKEARFHVLPELSYSKGYYGLRLFSNPNQDNLDRKKLLAERKKMVDEIEMGNENGETLAKSIKVVINVPGISRLNT